MKKLLLATDLPVALFAAKIANMLSDGLQSVEIFPGIRSEPSKNNACIIAYAYEMPKEVFDFILKNTNKDLVIYLSHQVATSLGQEALRKISGFLIRDTNLEVVIETCNMLEFLSKEK